MTERYESVIKDVTLLTPQQMMTLRDYIDGLLKINIVQGWRDRVNKAFIKQCLETSIKEFKVVDQIQIHNGIVYFVQGRSGNKESERYNIFMDGILTKKLAERMPEAYVMFSEKVGEGETVVVCTPAPRGIHYLRIENTTGYFRLVNGKLITLDKVEYKMAGFET